MFLQRNSLTTVILTSFVIFNSFNFAVASGSYCSFVGSSTATALQYTGKLASELRKVKDACMIPDRTFSSIANIDKYLALYQDKENSEFEILRRQTELEKYRMAFDVSTASDEQTFWMEKMLETRTSQIEAESLHSILKDQYRNRLVVNTIDDMANEISIVINDVDNYKDCLDGKPLIKASIFSGVIKLAGSLAAIATVNPLWAASGNAIGGLVTQIAKTVRNEQWQHINELDKMTLFFDFMCMIEIQSNYYCEKNEEIKVIEKMMDDEEQGVDSRSERVWNGSLIQLKAIPAFQKWVNTLYHGATSNSSSHASEQDIMRDKIASARSIQNYAWGLYADFDEKINEGGDAYNLLRKYSNEIVKKMVNTSSYMSRNDIYSSGKAYFEERFEPSLVLFLLVSKTDLHVSSNFSLPTCPNNAISCSDDERFKKFIFEEYGENTTAFIEAKAKMKNNLDYIFTEVNKLIDRDLIKRRVGDATVLLAQAYSKESLSDLTPYESLAKVNAYLNRVIQTLKKYFDIETPDNSLRLILTSEVRKSDTYISNLESFLSLKVNVAVEDETSKSTYPIQLQLVMEAKFLVENLIDVLDNNVLLPAERIERISALLNFKERVTLLFIAKMLEILKADLLAQVALGTLESTEEDIIYLKEKDMLNQLRKEGRDSNKGKAVDDRQEAKLVVVRNLESFVAIPALYTTITTEIKRFKNMYDDDLLDNLDSYAESCTLLLSLPYRARNDDSRELKDSYRLIKETCRKSVLKSEWNKRRIRLGLEEISELNVSFDSERRKTLTGRICTYRNYRRRDDVYGLKRAQSN